MFLRLDYEGFKKPDSRKPSIDKKEERNMSARTDTVKKFMELQEKKDYDGAIKLVTDDISVVAPMAGTTTGKAAVKAGWQRMPAGPKITWSQPTEEGDIVKTTASSPFGRLTMLCTFKGDKIGKVEIKLG